MRSWRWLEKLVLSPGGREGLSILIFHRIRRQRDPLRPNEPTAVEFEAIVRFLARNFVVESLYDAAIGLGRGGRPFHSVAITFDDGYADNYEVALPILERHGLCATFFVASGLLDGGVMWNDVIIGSFRATGSTSVDLGLLGLGEIPIASTAEKRDAIRKVIGELKYRPSEERHDAARAIAERLKAGPPEGLMMTSDQLRRLSSNTLAEIGGHTHSHPILARVSPDEARREIQDGKECLEAITQTDVRCFAYPNGDPGRDFNFKHVEMVKRAGFELAVTTSPGGARPTSDRFQLPRFTPWDREAWRFGVRMLVVGRQTGLCLGPEQ